MVKLAEKKQIKEIIQKVLLKVGIQMYVQNISLLHRELKQKTKGVTNDLDKSDDLLTTLVVILP